MTRCRNLVISVLKSPESPVHMDDKTMSVLEIHYQHKAHHLFDLKFVATRSRSCVYRHPMLNETQKALSGLPPQGKNETGVGQK